MSTSLRIVLLDTFGDEMFSGSSLLSTIPPPPASVPETPALGLPGDAFPFHDEEEEESVPPTLRSSVLVYESGEYPASRPIHVSDASDTSDASDASDAHAAVVETARPDSNAREEEDNRAA